MPARSYSPSRAKNENRRLSQASSLIADMVYTARQDKLGHWRLAKVPTYSTNPVHAYPIEERMKQLGRLDRYQKELAKITRSKNMPFEWASPDQRCRAAIKSVGRYGQVIPLSSGRNQIQK
jgi:hypothetical protein